MLICQDFFSLSDHFSAINIGQQTRSAPNIWIFGCRHTKKSSTSATSLSTKRAIVNHLKWLLVHCQTTHQSFPHQCIVSFSRLVLITHIHTNHIQKQRCHQASNQRLGFVYRQLVTTSEATRPNAIHWISTIAAVISTAVYIVKKTKKNVTTRYTMMSHVIPALSHSPPITQHDDNETAIAL